MSKEEVYEFDEEFLTHLLGFLFRDVSFLTRTDGLVKPNYFESEVHGALASVALQYYQKYKTVPSRAALGTLLQDSIDRKVIRKELVPDVKDLMKQVYKEDLHDISFMVDKVAAFAKRQELTEAILKCADLIDKGDYDKVESIINKAVLIGENKDGDSYDFFGEIANRADYREEILAGRIKPTGVTTGWKKLDNLLYHKGWGRQELSVLMAPAKAGKSMGLVSFASTAVLAGHNVLFVSLEVSTRIVADRLDANMTSTEINNLTMQLKKTKDGASLLAPKAGKLIVHDYPSGTFTPSQLRRLLHRYKACGTTFDLVIVDYADIMRPDHVVDESRENSRQIYLGLRQLACEFDCAMLSATQTNRAGFNSTISKMEHVAEDINKVRTVDLMLSLNPSADGQTAKIFFAASRNQGGHTIDVKMNLAMAKFIAEITKIDDTDV